MDRGQIVLKLSIGCLGLPFRIDSFEDRLILQKVVYLIQTIGVNLGYYFQWYLHGPYSPSLTQDAYAISAELASGINESKNWKLGSESENRLQRLKDLVVSNGSQQVRARKLELLASVHFLIDRKQVPGRELNKIHETLVRFGKKVTEREIHTAIKELNKYGLLQA